MTAEDKGVKLVLRFPTKKLHADLKRRAKAEGRSLNQMIVIAIQKLLETK